jgi:RPA family protein
MEQEPDPEKGRRQVAFKVKISDILNNKYVKEEGWLPNYVLVGAQKISRVNVLGVIVSKQADEGAQTFILDDGSGRIELRFFTPQDFISPGDIVTVIGRPREFGADRYIVPEIMKRVKDPKWVEVRKKELILTIHQNAADRAAAQEEKEDATEDDDAVETDDLTTDPRSNIINTIKQLDNGPGAEIEEITVKSGVDNAEFWIKKLLETGDVFEVKPGRFKVLE